jgi:hypothetical protein
MLLSYRQNGFIVRDLRAAIDYWTRVMRVGPFVVFEHADYGDVLYRGEPTSIDASTAMAWWGDLQVELIEQHNDAASVYKDYLHSGKTGLHHLACYTSDYTDTLAGFATRGMSPVQVGGGSIGIRYCYLQTEPAMGWMVELIEATPEIQAMNDELRAVAGRWDGRTQLHTLG